MRESTSAKLHAASAEQGARAHQANYAGRATNTSGRMQSKMRDRVRQANSAQSKMHGSASAKWHLAHTYQDAQEHISQIARRANHDARETVSQIPQRSARRARCARAHQSNSRPRMLSKMRESVPAARHARVRQRNCAQRMQGKTRQSALIARAELGAPEHIRERMNELARSTCRARCARARQCR